jgi:serine protease Do
MLPRRASLLAAVGLVGLWCILLLSPIPLAAEQLWEDGHATPLKEQPLLPSFTELAKALKPAVVNISSKQEVAQAVPGPKRSPFGRGEDDPFQEFFDRFFGGRGRRQQRPALGTGFIINVSGFIVTNNHVVEDADEIKVTLSTQEEFDAKLIGRDPKTDLALLKINSDKPLPTVPFGNSDSLEVGAWVVAIGNPFGLGHTVTAGIVSAKGRIIGAGPYDDFIQTDASINPGNSGGPLFNLSGEVVGINTAIVAGGQGIGFAIPINLAKEVLLQLHDKGSVTRGWLGVAIQSLSADLLKAFNLKDAEGALVADVVADAPADKAGLQRGDIIVSFQGEKVHDSKELPRMVAAVTPGTTVSIEIIREGKRMTVPVKLGTLQDEDEPEKAARLESSDVEEKLGLQVEAITPDVARGLRLENAKGVVVSQVAPDSPAGEAGVRRGDVVREVNRHPVTDLDSYNEATSQLTTNAPVLFLVERRGNSIYIALKPPKAG